MKQIVQVVDGARAVGSVSTLKLLAGIVAVVMTVTLADRNERAAHASQDAPPKAAAGEADAAAGEAEAAARTVTGLRIRQEARGIPGRAGGEDQRITQVISVTEDRLRLDDTSAGSYLLLKISDGEHDFYEVAADESQYRKGKDLDKIQKDRDRLEKQLLTEILAESAEARKQRLRDEHLRADGSREVTVETKPAEGKVLGHGCSRYIVRENGRVIVDVDVTDELEVTIPFFDYYRRVGAFSDEVLEELKKIKGVPLRADITVVTAGLNYELSVLATNVAKTSFRSELFDLPKGATEIVESTVAPCAECGKTVEKSAPGGRMTINSQKLYFCCKECKNAFKKRRYGKLKRPGATPGGK